MKTVTFPNGIQVPALGQGTWFMGESHKSFEEEANILRQGLDLGLSVIDSAEMYANGGAERVVSHAIKGRRHDAFLVSKVLPSHASLQGTIQACERSLHNLGTDYIDLYLLHWRGRYPLIETISAFEKLIEQGKIKAWGVSNFDTSDMEDLRQCTPLQNIATDQILYNLTRRGIEYDLLAWCEQANIPIMAYSPIEQGRILKNAQLLKLAQDLNVSASTIALAWVLRLRQMIAIPKTSSRSHLEENRRAADFVLESDILETLDQIFQPPRHKMPLDVI
ncbi:aldo/keto reductase [Bartonella tamiae]|uniref:NADP-dependent oxidoreductase domain-containing protein n=1 Tax=Bartonella tamiae Th239 TaxID=1094558 RepID=J0R537_9HYPH|nr:aldo/keto reductase [Bartonella tamiae]EJF90789.1 hypothetical protein ME5_00625 [Bartonella tamiae Th239]EJF93426.1 hypothetical protein MEG_01257 [Bartonella tamiae Th307]